MIDRSSASPYFLAARDDAARWDEGLDAPPRGDDELLQAVDRLERRLHRSRGQAAALAAQAAELADVQVELLGLSRQVLLAEPRTRLPSGHPVLGDVEAWARMADELNLHATEAQARSLAADCAHDEAAEFFRSLEPLLEQPEAKKCFSELARLSTMELELKEFATHDEEGQDEAERTEEEGTRNIRFASMRFRLRRSMEQALRDEPPDEETRQAWKTDLVDRADVMLTAIDDMPPDKAAEHLQRLIDDIDWHERHVEPARGSVRRRLQFKESRLRAEHQERVLQHRLEGKFGRKNVARFERLILVLIVFVLGLLVVEMSVELSPEVHFWFVMADTACCAVFLWEFFFKLALVTDRWRWFRRHFLIDLVPSIPFGLFNEHVLDALRAGRAIRFLRLSRFVRYVRVLRPLIRAFRALGFLFRGMDRLVQRYGRLLNRNVILYPTREERERGRLEERSLLVRVRRLKIELNDRWRQLLLAAADDEQRETIALARLDGWRQARAAGSTARPVASDVATGHLREIPIENLLRRLAAFTPRDVEHDLAPDLVERLARNVRTFARPPVRWLPLISAYAPKLAAGMNDAEVIAAGARSLAKGVKKHHDRWSWVGDLYGTVTPSQFVDRLGTVLVKASFRPAWRLLLFGGFFLLTEGLLQLTGDETLIGIKEFLANLVGPVLAILGSVCFITLGLGFYLRRLAREATEYYERVVQAQYLPLTEILRTRQLRRSLQILYQRVLREEWSRRDGNTAGEDGDHAAERIELFERRVHQSLLGNVGHLDGFEFDTLDRVVLMYRDSLDGALFVDTDTRTTAQLLGDPAIRQVLSLSRRFSRRDEKAFQALDLERQKKLLGGPYLWFNCISRSIAHSVACLLVEYNRNAVPLSELPLLAGEDRRRYDEWLAAASGVTPTSLALEEAVQCVSTSFTALHFLDADPQRDAAVAANFGPAVLGRLERDRAFLIRRVFGAYPWHRLPKEQRVFNVFNVYQRRLSGGRMLLLPLFALWRSLVVFGRSVAWTARAVQEIRKPARRQSYADAADADFATAVRKIQRMRGPLVEAAIRLRGLVDPQYLDVPLPGQPRSHAAGGNVEDDLKFLDAGPLAFEEARRERRRAVAEMQRLKRLLDEGLLGRAAEASGLSPESFDTDEHRRAAATAYLADYDGARTLLSTREVLEEVFRLAALAPPAAPKWRPRSALWKKFKRYWKAHCRGNKQERQAAWYAVAHNTWNAAGALNAWAKHGDKAAALGEQRLGELLRHPRRISEQLVTVRAVQTLALLDILHYREHVFALGRYTELGDMPDEWLSWGTTA